MRVIFILISLLLAVSVLSIPVRALDAETELSESVHPEEGLDFAVVCCCLAKEHRSKAHTINVHIHAAPNL